MKQRERGREKSKWKRREEKHRNIYRVEAKLSTVK